MHSESRLSLYKCVFCQIVQRCWSNAKLEYYCIIQTNSNEIFVKKILHCSSTFHKRIQLFPARPKREKEEEKKKTNKQTNKTKSKQTWPHFHSFRFCKQKFSCFLWKKKKTLGKKVIFEVTYTVPLLDHFVKIAQQQPMQFKWNEFKKRIAWKVFC